MQILNWKLCLFMLCWLFWHTDDTDLTDKHGFLFEASVGGCYIFLLDVFGEMSFFIYVCGSFIIKLYITVRLA